MSRTDWCAHKKHDECRGKSRKFETITRRGKNIFTWLDTYNVCSCDCHKEKK